MEEKYLTREELRESLGTERRITALESDAKWSRGLGIAILTVLFVMMTMVYGLKTDVGDLKADVAVMKADVSDLKTDVTVLKANQERLQDNQKMIFDRLGTLESNQVAILDALEGAGIPVAP